MTISILFSALLALAPEAAAGWVLERVTHVQGAAGPSSEETLLIARGRVRENHADGTYFLWDVPRGLLFQVDPATRSYSGGPVKKMIVEVRKYLDQLRERIARMTDAEREELARQTQGMPMPVPLPENPPKWTVKKSARTAEIAGRDATLYEIYRDGALFEEKWIAPGFRFGDDLDYVQFVRWSRDLEGSFAAGMGDSAPVGEEIDKLFHEGIELKSVLFGDANVRIITEVRRLEEAEVPDSTFQLPPDYILKGTQSL